MTATESDSQTAVRSARFIIIMRSSSPDLEEVQRQRLLTTIFLKCVTLSDQHTETSSVPAIAKGEVAEIPDDVNDLRTWTKSLLDNYTDFRKKHGVDSAVSLAKVSPNSQPGQPTGGYYYVYKGRKYCCQSFPLQRGESVPWIERITYETFPGGTKYVEAEIYLGVEVPIAEEDDEIDPDATLVKGSLQTSPDELSLEKVISYAQSTFEKFWDKFGPDDNE